MSRDSSGNYTLPAGNPVAGGTLISTTWANPTMADLAAEITNSLDRNGRGGMLVPFLNADGTVITPGISFTNEPSSGLYRPLLTDVRMSIGGDDTTRWIDTSLQPIGERSPFEIWNGEVWHAPIVDGDSITVQDLTVDGVSTMSDSLTISKNAQQLILNGLGVVGAFNHLQFTRDSVNTWRFASDSTTDEFNLQDATGTTRWQMDQAGNAVFTGAVTIAKNSQALVLDAVGASGGFIYQQLQRDSVNTWALSSNLTGDEFRLLDQNGQVRLEMTQAGFMQVHTGEISAGGTNTNLQLSAIGVSGGVHLNTNFGNVLVCNSGGNSTFLGNLTVAQGQFFLVGVDVRMGRIGGDAGELELFRNGGQNPWIMRNGYGGESLALILMNQGAIVGNFDPNSGVYTATSLRSRKKDIEPVVDAIDIIKQLKPRTYSMNGSPSAGYIYDEVEGIFDLATNKSSISDKPFGVIHQVITTYLLSAVQELIGRVEDIEG